MLWKTISMRRGSPVRRPVVVMSIVCPRSSAVSIASCVAAISTSFITRVRSVFRQGSALPAVKVEVFGREPGFERRAPDRPLAVRHRVPGGVAVPALGHHVLAEDPFVGETKPLGGTPRRAIQRVAFPLQAPISQVVEGMTCHQVDRLSRLARPL